MAVYRVGIDIGGTFTDFVLVDEETGAMRFAKELTTPRDPSAACSPACATSSPPTGCRSVRSSRSSTARRSPPMR